MSDYYTNKNILYGYPVSIPKYTNFYINNFYLYVSGAAVLPAIAYCLFFNRMIWWVG